MRKSMIILPLALGTAGALLLAAPASAADSIVTVEVTAGELAISAPEGSFDLGSAEASTDELEIGLALGDVVVTDDRGEQAEWAVTVLATELDGPTEGGLISYATPDAVPVGIVTVTAANAADILTTSTVQTATAVSGANAATWSPTITVTLPEGAQVGVYTSTITHSVA
jgi:hypothetical protein